MQFIKYLLFIRVGLGYFNFESVPENRKTKTDSDTIIRSLEPSKVPQLSNESKKAKLKSKNFSKEKGNRRRSR